MNMKKQALLVAAVIGGFTFASAQTEAVSNKNDVVMTPEADDWAISIDATPFLNYFGNFLGGGNTAPTVGYTNGYPWSVKGKMFVDENTAYRAGIRLGFGSNTMTSMIDDASDNASTTPVTFPNLPAELSDTYKAGWNAVTLTGGMEMRRGKTRLQGFYGGEVLISMAGTKDSYTYGNALNTNTDATFVDGSYATDFSSMGGNNMATDAYGNTMRLTEYKTSSMTMGVRGFIGAEYFIIPKMSLGFEYGWGIGITNTKASYIGESVGTNGSGNLEIKSDWTDETKVKGTSIDSDIQNTGTALGGSGSINLTFHF